MTFLAILIVLPLSVCAGAYFLVRRKQQEPARIYPFPELPKYYVTREELEAAFETIEAETLKQVKEMFGEEKK